MRRSTRTLRSAVYTRCIGIVLGLHAFGCGGDPQTAEQADVSSGIARDKLLSALGPQEVLSLCEVTGRALGDLLSPAAQLGMQCTLAATFSAIVTQPNGMLRFDRQACERERDVCLARGPLPTSLDEADLCNQARSAPGAPSKCTATVGEYETCLNGTVHAAAEQQQQLSCAYLATQPVRVEVRASGAKRETEIAVPECDSFRAKCDADCRASGSCL